MKTIEMINARARKPEWSMVEPVNFCLEEGEHIAIVGRNGAGKSMFVDMITGRHPAFPDMVKYGFDEPYNYLKRQDLLPATALEPDGDRRGDTHRRQ